MLSFEGRDNLRIRFKMYGHRVLGSALDETSDLIMAKKPSAYPVLRRRVESRTRSPDEISSSRRFAQLAGRFPTS